MTYQPYNVVEYLHAPTGAMVAPAPNSTIGPLLLRQAREHLRVQIELDNRPQTRIPNRPPDHEGFQPDHEPFHEVGSIDLPLGGSAEASVLAFRVPAGYDGIITGVGNTFTGAGFTAGSGAIVWRIRRDGAYFRNYSNLIAEYGDDVSPSDLDGGLMIHSGELVEYTVEHPSAASALVGRVVCRLRGRIWPRR